MTSSVLLPLQGRAISELDVQITKCVFLSWWRFSSEREDTYVAPAPYILIRVPDSAPIQPGTMLEREGATAQEDVAYQ